MYNQKERLDDGQVQPDTHSAHQTISTMTNESQLMNSSYTLGSEQTQGDIEAEELLQRTPHNYLFGQVYGLWLYISLFVLTLIITHNVAKEEYGVYATVQTAINTILYIIAFGIEDAVVTFVPRLKAEHGLASTAHFLRRLLAVRAAIVLGTVAIILLGLPLLAQFFYLLPYSWSSTVASTLNDPILRAHTWPIAVYIVGAGIANLLNALCSAQMQMHRVLIINGLAQVALLGLSYAAILSGWTIDGVLWMQAIVGLLTAVGYCIWLAPLLLIRGASYHQPLPPVLQLGFSAWQTNLVSGALIKQISIILLGVFAFSLTDIGYFNLSFQLADAANILLVSGFAGVGGSALAAAFVNSNFDRLGRTWQVLIKVETLLAAPGLVFCLFNAPNLATALYGSKFDPVGPLLAIFLFFNILVRIIGTTIHQSSLYVIGRPVRVLFSQWIGLAVIIGLGIVLIPRLGAAGALIADGVAKTLTGTLLLFFFVRYIPRHYTKELLIFTLRFICALGLAAIPGVLWHPTDRLMLGLSGFVFILLCLGLLVVIKPLSQSDMAMLENLQPRVARQLKWFARSK